MTPPLTARGRRPQLNKDTRVCISLAARPSNIGTRFHNYLYDELGLDYLYKAFTTTDIAAAIGGVRALGIRGCSVSMPFKKDVMALVDEIEPSALAIDAVNTIVNDLSVPGGHLVASNTDYLAVQQLIERLDRSDAVLIRGSGGMANAVGAALRDKGFHSGTVVARNPETGRALAQTLGYDYAPEVGALTAPSWSTSPRSGWQMGRTNTAAPLNRPRSRPRVQWSTWWPCPPKPR
ncbi:shikimate 5-dehydrogenase [Mycolicibacterium conceptionense]|uniref:Shikimate 5-dehydrogenase n=1 Tax=Mycolicibacterium conceptionense TaxID=451644 RepID=A0A0U1DG23_9MYCO|nr:shikimate 5-dehydrogenase [Mycolicibacterium conceptionense]